ncbi:MAG: PEP-CTERM sorting domain-containing protein [Verrucomicrobia bacterium]|nr:PEP-CTERM sorting domain-containing protein [Verrucomicrobiota bacterium]MCH8526863.1 PEP-CTERM sorting domain-containing protein [Kiritimatiellia bacterium]
MELTFSVVNLGGSRDSTNTLTTTIAALDLPSGLGSEFGVGARLDGATAEFSNLSIIPEPGTLMLVGLTGLALVFSARRKRG